MTNSEKALMLHEKWNGKIDTVSKAEVNSREVWHLAYTPGVAEPCKVIAENPDAAYKYTIKANTVAVVSDGAQSLDLAISALWLPCRSWREKLSSSKNSAASTPFLSAWTHRIRTRSLRRLCVSLLLSEGLTWKTFPPRAVLKLRNAEGLLDIPVFHDDQHGTAIVVLAGIINALKVTGKTREDCRVVVNGAGSAGIAISKLLLTYGFRNVMLCDKAGILARGMDGLNWMQEKMMEVTNLEGKRGTLADALKGADIFVGVSAPGIVSAEMVSSMNRDAILFAMANPVPEIMPDIAKAAGARVVGTGRSDFPNQVNNVLIFPGIFKGALEGRATAITEEMKLAAAAAIAGLVDDSDLNDENILPAAFDPRVADVVSRAVKEHIQ